MLTHTSAVDVSRYLVWVATHERPDEPLFLTNLHIQKLLYFVQGWTLAEWDRPMFRDPLEAWTHGPVVRSVWKRYEPFGKKPVEDDEAGPSGLIADERQMVEAVWSCYKRYSPIALADMTHEDLPWRNARQGLDPSAPSGKRITQRDLAECFRYKLAAAQKRLAAKSDQLLRLARRNRAALEQRRAI